MSLTRDRTRESAEEIGQAAGISRSPRATGFFGHGFLQAPAVREIARDPFLGVEPPVDVGALSADRFTGGAGGAAVRPQAHVI
ncbi:hypothetical protein [Streptomyces sp. MUM 178J]|uniref:hypothetical protein n=1 Tax=Streptomyces sp. MUM 178J TaxID=2791991 RepID=UPI0027E33431|nr:hypothetical protein [Streptomyces sp. MUM 178J]WRQ78263.1 hypothetical protein I3F59_002040 [Streptomyces sp. MUM 178J]